MKEPAEEKPKETPQPSKEEGALEEVKNLIPEEVLEKIPPEHRKIIREATSIRGMAWSGPMPNPVLSKVTSEHVGEIIRHAENEDVREHEERKGTRRYTFSYFIVTAILLIGILVFLTVVGLTDLFLQILLILGGVGAGFGLGRLRKSRE